MSNILISPLGHGLLMPFLSDTNSIAIALHMISDCATFKCKFPNAATLDKIYTLSMTTPKTEVIAQIYQMFTRLASSTKARHLLRSGMSLSDTTRLSVVTTHLEQLLHPEFPCSEENGNSEQEKEESEESEEEEEGDGKGKGKGKKELNDAAISSQVFQTRLRLLHLLVVNDLASTKNNNNNSSSSSSSSSSKKKQRNERPSWTSNTQHIQTFLLVVEEIFCDVAFPFVQSKWKGYEQPQEFPASTVVHHLSLVTKLVHVVLANCNANERPGRKNISLPDRLTKLLKYNAIAAALFYRFSVVDGSVGNGKGTTTATTTSTSTSTSNGMNNGAVELPPMAPVAALVEQPESFVLLASPPSPSPSSASTSSSTTFLPFVAPSGPPDTNHRRVTFSGVLPSPIEHSTKHTKRRRSFSASSPARSFSSSGTTYTKRPKFNDWDFISNNSQYPRPKFKANYYGIAGCPGYCVNPAYIRRLQLVDTRYCYVTQKQMKNTKKKKREKRNNDMDGADDDDGQEEEEEEEEDEDQIVVWLDTSNRLKFISHQVYTRLCKSVRDPSLQELESALVKRCFLEYVWDCLMCENDKSSSPTSRSPRTSSPFKYSGGMGGLGGLKDLDVHSELLSIFQNVYNQASGRFETFAHSIEACAMDDVQTWMAHVTTMPLPELKF